MSHHKRVGNWMQTFSGRQFWPMDPKPEDVCILDIANSLGKICRYNGHCKKFYSVAEHSYYVSKYVEPQNALWGLLHDASEAYMCDLIRPLKNEPFARSFRLFENKIIEVIAEAFELGSKMIPYEVKLVDNAILADELEKNNAAPPAPWEGIENTKLNIDFEFWSPEEAPQKFLNRFFEIYKGEMKK